MSIVSQKVDARNEIAWSGFVWSANKGIVRDATGWVLAPIGITPEAFTTDIADVQGQFPIVYNTDRMPYIPAVHNTAYYYDSSVAGGAITTTVTTTPIGKGVVSEEGNYILLDLVPTINKSVLWDQPWSVPTVINVNTPIEENPDRTVQKIETDWSKILIPFDPFYVDWSDQVFAKPTDVFIPSNANTDEFMMIDTATGQLKISTERIKEIWAWIFSNLPTSSVSFNTSWFDYYEKQQNLLTVLWLTAIPWRKWTFVWFIETTFASAWNEFSNSLHSLVFCTKNSGIALNWLWILWRSSQTSYTLLWSQNIQWLATNSAIYIDNVQNWDVLWWLLRILVDDWWTQTNSANWVNYYTEVVGHFISLKL